MGMNGRLLRPLARLQAPLGDPFATLVTTRNTGDVFGSARSTTGYIKVEWWDATSNVYGTGGAGDISWSKGVGGAGSKTLRVYPSDASGNLNGSLTHLNCSSNLTSLDVSGCTALTQLYVPENNDLTSLDVSGLTALEQLEFYATSIASLDASGLTALTYLNCSSNVLTSLDVSGCTALTQLNCRYNYLTSLRAQNVGMSGGTYYWSNADIRDNQLNAAALDQFYTDLAAGSSPLLVGGNEGTTGDDPSIATNKGYTVYGS